MRSIFMTFIFSIIFIVLSACGGKDIRFSPDDQKSGALNQPSTTPIQAPGPQTDPATTPGLMDPPTALACPQNIGRVTLTYSYGGHSCLGNNFPHPIGYAPDPCYPGFIQLSAPASTSISLFVVFNFLGRFGEPDVGGYGIQLPAGSTSLAIGSIEGTVQSIRLAECQWNNQLVNCSCLVDFAVVQQP